MFRTRVGGRSWGGFVGRLGSRGSCLATVAFVRVLTLALHSAARVPEAGSLCATGFYFSPRLLSGLCVLLI